MRPADKSATLFNEGEILFPKLRPYLNKTHLARFHGICSTEFHVLRPTKVEAAYLTAVLRSSHIVGLTALLMTGNTLPRLQTQDIKELPIPIPPTSVQDRVASIWQAALEKQSAGDTEARSLLSSIDDILLSELGIPRVSKPKNELADRIFTRRFSEVSGTRFDPSSHRLPLHFKDGRYNLMPILKSALLNPTESFNGLPSVADVAFVPMESVSEVDGEITSMEHVCAADSGSYTRFREGDVLWAKITPCMENGKSAIARHLVNGFGYGSTEFHVFRVDPSLVSPDYLHAILRLRMLRQAARMNFTGSTGHQRVDPNFFAKLRIPVPPLVMQQKIVDKIAEVRLRAKRLREEASNNLESAKQEIESIILGKTV